jgi:hypothetical protein
MEWINVESKLPELNKRVLIFYNNGAITISRLKSFRERTLNDYLGLGFIEVETQWSDIGQSSDVEFWCELTPPR